MNIFTVKKLFLIIVVGNSLWTFTAQVTTTPEGQQAIKQAPQIAQPAQPTPQAPAPQPTQPTATPTVAPTFTLSDPRVAALEQQVQQLSQQITQINEEINKVKMELIREHETTQKQLADGAKLYEGMNARFAGLEQKIQAVSRLQPLPTISSGSAVAPTGTGSMNIAY